MNRTLLVLMLACTGLTACGGSDNNSTTTPAAVPNTPSAAELKDPLTYIDETKMISSSDATSWLKTKDGLVPAYAGSAKYDSYIAFLETKMREYGLVDFTKYTFPYSFWGNYRVA